jgi:hypothetical protein
MIVQPIATFVRGAVFTAILGAALPVRAADQSSVSPGDIAYCARMTGADERLACYDDLARRKSARAPAAPAPAAATAASSPTPPSPTPQSATQANPPAASAPVATQGTAVAPTTQAQSAQSSAGSTGAFGLSRHEQVGPDVITATVSKVSYDQLGNINVYLQNGQLWTFNDSDGLLRPGDTVTIKHASLGSFLMLTPDRQSHRVKRLR